MRFKPSISCMISSTDFKTARPGSVKPRMRFAMPGKNIHAQLFLQFNDRLGDTGLRCI